MSLRPIEPEDSRIQHKTAVLNGNSYHYLYGIPPSGKFRATVFLVSKSFSRWVHAVCCNAMANGRPHLQIHGWPDLSLGWRYQIPMLLNLGFRVVAPDLMGFGGTVCYSTHQNMPHDITVVLLWFAQPLTLRWSPYCIQELWGLGGGVERSCRFQSQTYAEFEV